MCDVVQGLMVEVLSANLYSEPRFKLFFITLQTKEPIKMNSTNNDIYFEQLTFSFYIRDSAAKY